MLPDLLISIALTVLLVLFLRLADRRADVWPAPTASHFDLGWPRGVQEEEPVRYRTELVTTSAGRQALPPRDATNPARLSPTRA